MVRLMVFLCRSVTDRQRANIGMEKRKRYRRAQLSTSGEIKNVRASMDFRSIGGKTVNKIFLYRRALHIP